MPAASVPEPRLPEPGRRVFLARALQALGVAATLPWLGSACAPAPDDAPSDLRVLSPGEWAVLDAAADAFVPRGGAFEPGARDVGLAARVDAHLARSDPELASGLRGGLVLLEWGGGLVAGRPGRFSRKSAEDRAAVLAALQRGPRLGRELFAGLKQLCCFFFYSADASWPGIGYDGPWVVARGSSTGDPG